MGVLVTPELTWAMLVVMLAETVADSSTDSLVVETAAMAADSILTSISSPK